MPEWLKALAGPEAMSLIQLLNERNGFYAFEGALHVLPSNCADRPRMALERWNSDLVWRDEFGSATKGLLFFAEDLFGEQFALCSGKIWRFNPESGERNRFANDLDDWARKILADFRGETGYPLSHQWQLENEQLEMGKRLISKIPFVLGGKYEIDKLFALDAVKAMHYRADIYRQLQDLPDGTSVKLRVEW